MRNLLFFMAFIALGCNSYSQTGNTANVATSEAKVLVYFFHSTNRCPGCVNAEKATVTCLNDLYKEQLEKGTVRFESVNVEDAKNKVLVEKYEAAWNKLIFVKNDNSGKVVELTQQAFAHGRNPDGLKPIVQTTVDNMLK